jgi:hypothetical protein
LPSSTEIFGNSLTDSEGNLYDLGTPYAYYQNNSTLTKPANTTADANRIKYDQNKVATKYFLRNAPIPSQTQATTVTILIKTGGVTSAGVINAAQPYAKAGGTFLAPCCCIV